VSACGADTEATIFSLAARREVQRGTCEAGVAALDRWQFGRAQGWVLCGEDMLWTYDQTNLLGRVRGPDASTTFQWWHENARFPAEWPEGVRWHTRPLAPRRDWPERWDRKGSLGGGFRVLGAWL